MKSLKNKALAMPVVLDALTNLPLARPEWLAFNETARSAKITRLPMADEIPFPIAIQQVVEYYTQRL